MCSVMKIHNCYENGSVIGIYLPEFIYIELTSITRREKNKKDNTFMEEYFHFPGTD